MQTPVIYCIQNIVNRKVYVGSSTTGLAKRKYEHLLSLRKGKHRSIHLQRAYNKYGEMGFKFFVLEVVKNKTNILEREQYWIDKLRPYLRDNGYNISPTAGNNAGSAFYQDEGYKEKQRQKCIRLGLGEKVGSLPRTLKWRINTGKAKTVFTESQIAEIKDLLWEGVKQKDIAGRYGVCQQTISHIARGKGKVYGGEFRSDYKPVQKRTTITDEMRQQIIDLYKSGTVQTAIAERFGITQAAVSKIIIRGRAR